MEEAQLITEAQKGNKAALNALLTENYKLVSGYCLKMTGNREEAQDIVQEALLKAVVNISGYRTEAKFSTWLVTIATNVYRDQLRRQKRFQPLAESQPPPEGTQASAEDLAVLHSEYQRVLDILKQLPYEKRAVFILKHYYGLKYEEIAQVLKCPVGTVRSRLHNAVKQILAEIAQEGGGEDGC